MALTPEALLAPYREHTLSAWDALRFAFSLCHHEGLEVKAYRGKDPQEGYWLSVAGQGIFCGRVNAWKGGWEFKALPDDGQLTLLDMAAIPASQLGFMLVETAHFDHC